MTCLPVVLAPEAMNSVPALGGVIAGTQVSIGSDLSTLVPLVGAQGFIWSRESELSKTGSNRWTCPARARFD